MSKGVCGIGFWDMLLRVYAPEEGRKYPLRHKWLFIAVSAPRQILFGGLVSVVSVYSGAVYGQICGQTIGKWGTRYVVKIQ